MMQVSAHSTKRHRHLSQPSMRQAWSGIGAAFGVALVAAYESVVLLAGQVGTLAALPLGVLAFIVVGAVALVAAARLDTDVLSR